jgi:chorismate dehydratase
MCARVFGISPDLRDQRPDLPAMLAGSDAALIIGDVALFQQDGPVDLPPRADRPGRIEQVHKIDLGELWTTTTGLPFVYAFWAGPDRVVTPDTVESLQRARDAGCANIDAIAAAMFDDSAQRAIGARYLRDNIRYALGPDERAGLERFYRYAAEAGVVKRAMELRFAGDVVRSD